MKKKASIKKAIEKLKKIDYRHYISIVLIITFCIMNITIFSDSWVRIGESLTDVWNSLKYYFCFLLELPINIELTVNKLSKVPFVNIFNLPQDFETFKLLWNKYWQLIISADNFSNYFEEIILFISNFSKIAMLVILPLIMILFILFRNYFTTENNDYNKDSKILKLYKKSVEKWYLWVKNKVLDYIYFIKQNKKYYYTGIFIWCINFNIITIGIEFLAYYLYFACSFDIINLYIQFYKLLSDLSVMIAFIPLWLWCVIGYIIFDKIRSKKGYGNLRHLENRNCGFINERPLVMMLCGTMGKKKTTIITDIALSKESLLKSKALNKIALLDSKFPHFPWVIFEEEIKRLIKAHKLYNLSTCRKYIERLELSFFKCNISENEEEKESIKKELSKKNDYDFKKYNNDFLFGYDYEKYGLEYDNALYLESLFSVLKSYMQLYFVYTCNTSYIISNYSIRSDIYKLDKGNFPKYNTDFFNRPTSKIIERSKYAHIIDFDAMRLGQKMKPKNKNKDSFDFGVVAITEIGKERKNQLELKGSKKDDYFCNQLNDGFNDWLKMVRHSATIDNFPFVKIITDEQRPESWGADARDLCDICTIKETSDFEIAIPFFNITELLHNWVYNKYQELYYKYRHNRADNTLFMYLLKGLVNSFHSYYVRKHNTFDYCVCEILVEEGTQKEKGNIKKYYLMTKKIYSQRFTTDCFSDFFNEKTAKSKVGINDMPSYALEKATFKELQKQNSYFVNDLQNKKNKI